MWIVEIALKRPYTFIVLALLIILATPFVLFATPTDIFPEINIPVLSIIWNYNGLSPKEMSDRIVSVNERGLTTTVNDIEHIESQSLTGVGVVKVFFQPGANIPTALAQVVSMTQAQLRQMPPGQTPPLVIKYSASSIPILQLGLSSPTLSEQELNDVGLNQLRTRLITVPGVAVPYPYGGKLRLISVDLDTSAMLAHGISPTQIVSAIGAQNLILPSGTQKIGNTEYDVALNGTPETIALLNAIPIKTTGGTTVYLRDVAHVRDGYQPQTNIVRKDGQRGALLSVIKNGNTSTLAIVSEILHRLPIIAQSLPKEFTATPLFDQSLFVKAAISGVIREALIAACLTAAMILLFLGNWRSTVIIAVSIPLSILTSIIVLHMLGETINLMTLGGLALAVGILVDDATVTIENIERHLHEGKEGDNAILLGAAEIAVPALVSTLCICIVFVPMFFLTGVARYLFVPMAEAVVFAMLASYVLSRTLVPTLVKYLMAGHMAAKEGPPSLLHRVYQRFDAGFERVRANYVAVLDACLAHSKLFMLSFFAFCVASCGIYLFLGHDFFPDVDAGQIRLHMRGPSGLRVEETARLADQVEAYIHTVIPAHELKTIVDNIGLPYSGINLSYSNAGTIGTSDTEFLIALDGENHHPSTDYIRRMRKELPEHFPGVEFTFQPADIISQILNFGLPSAVDIQFTGKDVMANHKLAGELVNEIKTIPGAVDTHIQQRFDRPGLQVTMDRVRLQQTGLNGVDVAQNMLVSLSSSQQTTPTFWLNRDNSIVYNVAVQTPQYKLDSLDELLRTPVSGAQNGPNQLLGNLVSVSPMVSPAVVSHYDLQPAVDIYTSVSGRDLGGVANDVQKKVDAIRAKLPRGSQITIRGQVDTMQHSFIGLGVGLVMAIALVYLLIVVNFQSWLDPLIIITALPAALAGIAWTLFLTGTTLSVPSLTGAIMTMGVATANSILVISFARDRLHAGASPLDAALEAGATRLRPVLMTALAMIIGMVPMAIGFGEGAEQNAPLGRAVIGGLLFATVSTLFFVPTVFASLYRYNERRRDTHRSEPVPV
ncbi:MAG: efflux RND transporter permease subunit [Burkholderiales bacterium]|nr:efflux RND transporter permease subunit [Burkholderiales bacterium]